MQGGTTGRVKSYGQESDSMLRRHSRGGYGGK